MNQTEAKQSNKPKFRNWKRWAIEVALLLLLFFGLRAWQQRDMLTGSAPDFERIGLNGESLRLSAYQGKPVLLHFWASWCSICEFEQGSVSAIAKDYPVLTVAFQSGKPADLQAYMQRKGIAHWVTVMDEDGQIAKQYGILGVPTSYVLDSQGQIRFKEVGFTSEWGMRARLWLASLW